MPVSELSALHFQSVKESEELDQALLPKEQCNLSQLVLEVEDKLNERIKTCKPRWSIEVIDGRPKQKYSNIYN